MNIKQTFPCVFFVIVIIGCSSPSKEVTADNIKEYFESDSTLKMSGLSAEEINALKEIKEQSGQITSARKRNVVYEDSVVKVQDHVFPDGKVAGVFIQADKRVTNYSGQYRITSVTNNKVTGTVADASGVNIFYRLPSKQQLALPVDVPYQLHFEEQVIDGSMERLLTLTDTRGVCLVAIEQGSKDLFKRNYDQLGLDVKQVFDKKGFSLEIVNKNEKFIMRAGEKHASGNVEFYLASSTGSTTDPSLVEGSPYFIRLYLYRVK